MLKSLLALLALLLATQAHATPACDRTCLLGFIDQFAAALSAHNPATLPVAPGARITENDEIVALGDGIWKTPGQLGRYRIAGADPVTGQAALLANYAVPGAPKAILIGLRLRVEDRRITEIELIVPQKLDQLNPELERSTAHLTIPRPGFSAPLYPFERSPRETMRAIGQSYYAGIEGGTGEIVAFADDCHRIENGVATTGNPTLHYPLVSPTGRALPEFGQMGCRAQFDARMYAADSITGLRIPVIDETTGNVFAFSQYHTFTKAHCVDVPFYGPACAPPGVPTISLAMLEIHHIKDGLIHEQESVWTILPRNDIKSPWAP